jgi:two-component system response regulator YesN
MKLLIVDDEELTRTGLIASVNWNELGIDEVYQADDGLHGLEAARKYKPEIILCDVRMPRMTGIAMLEQLETILPDTISIFMSGYSDKEYLKAAIKLKAVNYIEKPLDPQEVREAVLEAKEQHIRRLHSHRGETLHSMETASRLALQLTLPYGSNNMNTIEQLLGELDPGSISGMYFTAFIVKLDSDLETTEPFIREKYQNLAEYLHHFHLQCIHVEKRSQHLVYFVFGSQAPSQAVIASIGKFLGEQFAFSGRYFIAAGESFSGISRAYQSYTSAVILLQNAFIFPENSFLISPLLAEAAARTKPSLSASPETVLGEALSNRNQNDCQALLEQLAVYFDRNTTLLRNQVKDLYYKLLLTLDTARRQLKIPASSLSGENSIAEKMEQCFTFRDLHQLLESGVEQFFLDASSSVEENPTIFLIKEYISTHYMQESLSVKDISSHVYLSASYVCTFFKNETGQTLNQYLTEYRMERAKQLLSDPRYKITDISSRVGYSDGNYFGKSFKKYCGLSPSEYRERITQ